ncbi:MAG: carboxypeptidase regulatory-like domain-containing protein [Bacillota bacterium]|nr:carboxypeptidase regulatory-like domain-containing protein [Bacillota bacterium]
MFTTRALKKSVLFFLMLFFISTFPEVNISAAGTVSLRGYIGNDNNTSIEGASIELTGTQYSAVTDSSGYFNISGVPFNQSYSIKITKSNYLTRLISNISFTGDAQLGTQSAPVTMWIGDITKDDAINMADIIELGKYFNRTSASPDFNNNVDINGDGSINMSDVILIARHFGRTSNDYPEVNPVFTSVSPSPTINPTSTPTTAPTYTPTPTQGTSAEDRYFPAGTSKTDLIAKAKAMKVSETKALMKKQIDEHWDLLVSVCGFKSKETAYAFFFGFATRESTFRAETETGGGSAHSFGPIQTAETAFANANPSYMPETNVPEMFQYDYKDDTFYDVGISVHMGIRHFLHFARLAKEKYSGVEVLRHGLMGFNTGWIDGSDPSWIAQYADEIASAAGWYLTNNHLSDDEFTWDMDPRINRSNPWGWY